MDIRNQDTDFDQEFSEAIDSLALRIEDKFNTRVYKHGIAKKGTDLFKSLTPFGVMPPQECTYLIFFLVPIDTQDFIITNDYYEKSNKLVGLHPAFPSTGSLIHEFNSILKSDWDLGKYLKDLFGNNIYTIGSMKVSEYNKTDNLVDNIEKIEDIRYRFIRFFS